MILVASIVSNTHKSVESLGLVVDAVKVQPLPPQPSGKRLLESSGVTRLVDDALLIDTKLPLCAHSRNTVSLDGREVVNVEMLVLTGDVGNASGRVVL